MTNPFSSSFPAGTPLWASVPATSGNFSRVNVLETITIPEIGYGEGGYGEGGYDTPSSTIQAAGEPIWIPVLPNSGNFSPVNVLGMVVVPEIGYGEGGYGAGGYDTPTSVIQAAATPIWVTGSPE